MKILRIRSRRNVGRGQSLVEFALILPIFLLMLFGLLDIGRLVYMNSTLSQAAREGARLAAVQASWVGLDGTPQGPACNAPGGPTCPADVAELRVNVLDATNQMMIPFDSLTDADLQLSCDEADGAVDWSSPPYTCSFRDPNGYASVRVEAPFEFSTPIISQLIGAIDLVASATMIIH